MHPNMIESSPSHSIEEYIPKIIDTVQMRAQRTEIIVFMHERKHIRRKSQADTLKHENKTEKLIKSVDVGDRDDGSRFLTFLFSTVDSHE